jgi:hypothetical protein
MSNIWFFGDSFAESCGYENWWGKILADELNMQINLESRAGSGVYFLYLQLLKNLSNIDKDDIILIFYSTPKRFLFNETNFRWEDIETNFVVPGNTVDANISNAFKQYMLYLSGNEDYLHYSATLGFIQHTLTKKITCKKIVELYSFDNLEIFDGDESFFVATKFLKKLPSVTKWIKHQCQSNGYNLNTVLQTYGHFGDKTCGDLNPDFACYMKNLIEEELTH